MQNPDWTPPNVGEILTQFEERDPIQLRPELLDQYLESGNHAALRSLFDSIYRARNRAEHLSNTLLSYIHAQLHKEPHIKEYFNQQLDSYNTEGKTIRAERIEAAKKITRTRDRPQQQSSRTSRSGAKPAETVEW